jgi:HAD superfamily hydrolase (TIGR01490 family)|tara:strand:- start:74 stop:874 length:801 start_codon:yes stop_codon:yes gene_type:complete
MRYRGPMPVAAFFDLDKTILAKSSSFVFAKPFYKEGLIGRTDVMRSAYAQFMFLTSGADHDQMESMRDYMSELVTGWEAAKVQAIVAETLDTLIDPLVYQEAIDLISFHKEQGHTVIVISTSGNEMVEPISARLGADIAIGTQIAIVDGKYTGEIIFYAYGEGKAEAMQSLAIEHGFDLDECFAYSDSYTDLPMLNAVGNPRAVNPDSDLRAVAIERNWAVLDFEKPVSMQAKVEKRQAIAASAGVAIGAVALGLTWYAKRHSIRA